MLSKYWRKYLLFLLLVIFLAVEVPIISVGRTATPQPADVMIVLGAKLIGNEPSTMLRLRLDEAVRLYRQGYAPSIIVSGARGKDEQLSEAAAMRDYLIRQGIPANAILEEDKSFNTLQNLANSHGIMEEHGYNQAIIVSSASHIRRSLVLARHLGMNVSGAPAPMPNNLYLTTKQYLREGAAMTILAFAH